MQRSTCEEKRPLLQIRTHLAQLLQIPHLPYRRPPLAKQPLVETALLGIRPSFPPHCVSGNSREVLGVEPADGIHVALYANQGQYLFRLCALDSGGFICEAEDDQFVMGVSDSLIKYLLVPADKASSDNENVSLPTLGALKLQDLF